MNFSGIYKIVNTITNKFYIGSAANCYKRWAAHKSYLNNNHHHSQHLQNAWNKYGVENFKFEIIEKCEKENLILREQYFINSLNPEYNICPIAGTSAGRKLTEEHKKKLSISNTGQKRSEQTKMNVSKGLKKINHRPSDAVLKANAERMKGNKYRLGIKHTDERKYQISIFMKNRIITDKHKLNIGLGHKKLEKWPHGCSCQCSNCKDKRNSLRRNYRNNLKGNVPWQLCN